MLKKKDRIIVRKNSVNPESAIVPFIPPEEASYTSITYW